MTSYIFSIDGNIGSGKSTLCELFKKIDFINNRKIVFITEPVDVWTSIKNKENENVIECFYKDRQKYSFAFQMMAFISRLSQLKTTIKENPNCIIITERSVYTDKYIFAKMLYDDGLIDEIEYQIYNKWFDELLKDVISLNGIIYLKTTPEIAHERTQNRNRKGEENISLDYLKACNSYHEKWISNFENVLILDGDININSKDSMNNKDINESNIRNKLFTQKVIDFIYKSIINTQSKFE